MILAPAGGGGGLVLIFVVRVVKGFPFLSRALVPWGMVMARLPSAEVAFTVVCTMPALSILKLPAVPKRLVTTVVVMVPPPPPPPDDVDVDVGVGVGVVWLRICYGLLGHHRSQI